MLICTSTMMSRSSTRNSYVAKRPLMTITYCRTSPKDSAFLTNMRSHQKIFHQLAGFGRKPSDSRKICKATKTVQMSPTPKTIWSQSGQKVTMLSKHTLQRASHKLAADIIVDIPVASDSSICFTLLHPWTSC